MHIPMMNTYDEAARNFKWDIPDRFNFGRDVVDATAETADRLALIWTSDTAEHRTYNFSDISRLSNRLANVLRRIGVRQGDRVIIQLPRIPEWHFTMTACTKLGAIVIPCIEMLTAKDLTYRAQHSGAADIITTVDNVTKYEHCPGTTIRACFGDAPGWTNLADESLRELDTTTYADVKSDDPALMYYTSGSSGDPKGVIHASRAILAWRLSALYWQRIGPGDLTWCTADTGWAKAGTGVLFAPWGAGAAVLFHQGVFEARRRLEIMAQYKVNVFCAAATEFRHMVQEDFSRYDLSSLKRCVSAGEAVNPDLVEKWKAKAGVSLLDGYGQTETLMTILNYEPMRVKPGSMGKPMPGIHYEILSETGERLGDSEIGQIAMQLPVPQFMLGYWNAPEKTAASIMHCEGTPYWITGDLGYRDEDGYFFYTGRNDDVISSAGYRIGPMEVENALQTHPAILEAAVIGKPDRERGEIVKAFIVLREGVHGDDTLAEDIKYHVKATTAPYKYPREVVFVQQLPKTASGKILRRILRQAETAIT